MTIRLKWRPAFTSPLAELIVASADGRIPSQMFHGVSRIVLEHHRDTDVDPWGPWSFTIQLEIGLSVSTMTGHRSPTLGMSLEKVKDFARTTAFLLSEGRIEPFRVTAARNPR